MEQIGDMKFIDFEETLDRDLGKVGTPKRDEFERKVSESVHANQTQIGCNSGCKNYKKKNLLKFQQVS